MPSYVALLRGIGPGNPNMRNEKLREPFEKLGFTNVRTVITTGNVLFDTPSTAVRNLEAQIEDAITEQLGFTSMTIVRSKNHLRKLVDADPFRGIEHGRNTNLNVTFLKRKPRSSLKLPHIPGGRDYTILGIEGREIFSVIDLTSEKAPDLMTWLEKEFGKEITTRTYRTVKRVVARLTGA